MKKIILFISIFAFSFAISVFCFASDDTLEVTDTYSVSTDLDFISKIGQSRNRIKIDISNMPSNYVVIPYFRYSVMNNGNHWLNVSMAIYDKKEDITYISARSQSEMAFVQSFYDKGWIKLTEGTLGIISNSEGISYGLGEQSVIFPDLKSSNYELPYYVTSKFCSDDEFPFSLSDVQNKGVWFVEGNNYPFSDNSVYSSNVYSPAITSSTGFRSSEKDNYEYLLQFKLVGQNVKYTNLDNYFLEIWTSSDSHPDLVYQKSYKLTDVNTYDTGTDIFYRIIDDYSNIFVASERFLYQKSTVFVRFRYVDNNVNLVSSYQYYLQMPWGEFHVTLPNQVDDLLPPSQVPDSEIDGTFKPGSLTGVYNFGDFSALDFVNGQGGLPSLVDGISVVFGFLPSWLWQMMWYVLGALAVIALLKVIIS